LILGGKWPLRRLRKIALAGQKIHGARNFARLAQFLCWGKLALDPAAPFCEFLSAIVGVYRLGIGTICG
jgi:hypothetical protein